MAETWEVTEEGTLLIRQTTPLDLKSLTSLFRQWAEENNYRFTEKNFTEKVKSHGSEIETAWEFERKVTEYIMYKIHIVVWAHGMNPIEVNGKKLMQGHVEITFDSYVILDWQNRGDFSPLRKFMRFLYINYIKKGYFLSHWDKCWKETYSLHADVKAHLNLIHIEK